MNALFVGTFGWIIRSTWQASCLAVLVLLVQLLARRRLSARARGLLWFVVIGRLLLPPLPQVRWTLLHSHAAPAEAVTRRADPLPVTVPERVAAMRPVEPLIITAPQTEVEGPARAALDPELVAGLRARLAAMRRAEVVSPPVDSVAAPAVPAESAAPHPVILNEPARYTPLWPRIVGILPWVWLIGAGLAFSRIVISSVRLSLKLRRLPKLEDPEPNELLIACAREMGVRQPPELRRADALAGPALAGWVHPKLLVPGSVLKAFGEADLRLMFLHELAHVRRRDIAVNWIVSAVTALHWFNPLLLFCARRVRADCELACDELVLAATREDDASPRYGYTLLRLADWLAARREGPHLAGLGVVEILENSRELQRRIIMIARFNPSMKRWPAVVAGGALFIAGLALTDAAEPAATRPVQVDAAPKRVVEPMTGPAAKINHAPDRKTGQADATPTPRAGIVKDLEEKVAAVQAQVVTEKKNLDWMQKTFDAGLQTATEAGVALAACRVAEAQTAVTDAEIALARESAPALVPKLIERKGVEVEQLVQSRERVVKLQKQRHEAGLMDFTAVGDAQSELEKAKVRLADARIEIERSRMKAVAGETSVDLPPPSPQSLQRKLEATKAALSTAEQSQEVLIQHFKAGGAGVTDLVLWTGRVDLLRARLAVTDADMQLRTAMFGAQHPTLSRLREQKLNEMSDYVEALSRIASMTNAANNSGAATLDAVAKADEAEAKARSEMRAVEAEFSRTRSMAVQRTTNARPDKPTGADTVGSSPANAGADAQKVQELKVAAAEAKLKVLQSNADRIHHLVENNAASKSEDEAAVAEVASARAALAEEQLRLHQQKQGAVHNAGGETAPATGSEPQLQDADAERLDLEVSAKMNKPIKLAPLGGDAESLEGIVGALGKATGLNFVVEEKALQAAGVDPKSHLQLTFLNAPATASQVISWALRDLGGADAKLGYTIDHGAMLISTADEIAKRVVTRVYDVSDLKPQQKDEDLVSLIKEVVDPGTWRDRGGSIGSIRQFRDKLLVTQTQQNHLEVKRLLGLLRSKAAAAKAPDDDDAEQLARLLGVGFNENHPAVLAVTGRMAARAKEKAASLKNLTIQRMQEMMVAVRLFDQERGGMPKGFHIHELAAMVTFNANENPRMPYLTYGYRWVAPYVGRLKDIKDPAHTPIFCEVAPQADGTELVAYADGRVAEVKGDAVKALETKLDRGNKEATEQVQLASGAVITVPRAVVEQCKHIAEAYGDREIRLEDGTTLNPQEVEQIVREKIAARVQQFVQEGEQ